MFTVLSWFVCISSTEVKSYFFSVVTSEKISLLYLAFQDDGNRVKIGAIESVQIPKPTKNF